MTPEARLGFLAGLQMESRMQLMARFTWDARPFCFLHQRYCTPATPTIVVAGTPCVDHSQAGSRRTALFHVEVFNISCLSLFVRSERPVK
jgi:site-specific DNA-cytosine methylase